MLLLGSRAVEREDESRLVSWLKRRHAALELTLGRPKLVIGAAAVALLATVALAAPSWEAPSCLNSTKLP